MYLQIWVCKKRPTRLASSALGPDQAGLRPMYNTAAEKQNAPGSHKKIVHKSIEQGQKTLINSQKGPLVAPSLFPSLGSLHQTHPEKQLFKKMED